MMSKVSIPILAFALTAPLLSQTFDSGSNGSDGALILTTPGEIFFNPKDFNFSARPGR